MIIQKYTEETRCPQGNKIYLIRDVSVLAQTTLSNEEQEYIKTQFQPESKDAFVFNRFSHFLYVQICPGKEGNKAWEYLRKAADKAVELLEKEKQYAAVLTPVGVGTEEMLAFAEGAALGAYVFSRYKKDNENKEVFRELYLDAPLLADIEISRLENLVKSCFEVRDMVNEPVNIMDTKHFSRLIAKRCREAGAEVVVMDKKQIEAQGMEGLLTVNKGSQSDPAFTVIEWKPGNAANNPPIVLVGKGLVYDTGGINLKPGSGLTTMKCDMAGGAAVFGTLYALAMNKVPVHVVGLIPATDNRPGENAMVPGDIIRMGNGKTVEIINTDAEGRLILADALIYAKKYNPQLVIDIATLTGAAAVAIGPFGMAGVQQDASHFMAALAESGEKVYERIVELPFWEEYEQEIQSDVADLRNVGKGRGGGAITAGKFLAAFTDYPWIHLDIAPVAFLDSHESYLGKGGTAAGVRLLYHFLSNKSGWDTQDTDP